MCWKIIVEGYAGKLLDKKKQPKKLYLILTLSLRGHALSLLTHFVPLASFDTTKKHQNTSGFLMFLGGIEKDQGHEMVQLPLFDDFLSTIPK